MKTLMIALALCVSVFTITLAEDKVYANFYGAEIATITPSNIPEFGIFFTQQYDYLGYELGLNIYHKWNSYGFKEKLKLIIFPLPDRQTQPFISLGLSLEHLKGKQELYDMFYNSYLFKEKKLVPTISFGFYKFEKIRFFGASEFELRLCDFDFAKKEIFSNVETCIRFKMGF